MDPRPEFSRRLKAAMEAKGWRTSELTRRMNQHLGPTRQIREGHTWNWLTGRALPSGPRRTALCRALDLSEKDLIPEGSVPRFKQPRIPTTGSRPNKFAEALKQTMVQRNLRPSDLLRLMAKHLPEGVRVGHEHIQKWQSGVIPTGPRRTALCLALGIAEESLIPRLDAEFRLRTPAPPRSPDRAAFARRLSIEMAAREWTPTVLIREMAKHLPPGVTVARPTVWYWRNARTLPSGPFRKALCSALGLADDELFPRESGLIERHTP